MRFLRDSDFKIGFLTGFILHTIMLLTRISFSPFGCPGKDCSVIYNWDIPVAILYYAFDGAKVVVASFLIGSIYWGFLFYFILRGIKIIFSRRGTRRF